MASPCSTSICPISVPSSSAETDSLPSWSASAYLSSAMRCRSDSRSASARAAARRFSASICARMRSARSAARAPVVLRTTRLRIADWMAVAACACSTSAVASASVLAARSSSCSASTSGERSSSASTSVLAAGDSSCCTISGTVGAGALGLGSVLAAGGSTCCPGSSSAGASGSGFVLAAGGSGAGSVAGGSDCCASGTATAAASGSPNIRIPVFSYKTAAVVGVAFAGRVDVQGIGFIIPVPVIQLFVKTFEVTKHPIFAGLPMLGIATQDLVNPSLRRLCFGATTPPSRDGILVTEVHKDSCADRAGLMPGDVLVCIDETPISEKGDVPFRGHERLDWVYLVTRKPLGSKITLDVLRRIDGGVAGNKAVSLQNGTLEARRLHVTLAPTPSLLPSILGLDYTPGWVVIGGLLFLRVGQPLLDQIISGGRGAGVGGFTHITSLMGA
mmetsp:Transcript_43033/g.99710  ORF Transcript_43033/g.99710 Transcript_43033/m.99710 type:complete len:446 (-) Transcript_43033:1318-2655(-)